MKTTLCPVCQDSRKICFTETILTKYQVNYFYCSKCGLLQTELPYWLHEAYDIAIAKTDTGLIQRNLFNSQVLTCLLYFLFDKEGQYLDIAGGYGMLTRLIRDIGFDFFWTDKYCENLLASGFEVSTTKPPFAAITAFEILEHIHEPIAFLRKALSNFGTKTIIFTTELFKQVPPKPTEWWYYSFDNGQHISFYQETTLKVIARELDLHFYTHNRFHMMTDTPIKPAFFRILTTANVVFLLYKYICHKMKSKTISDFIKLSNKLFNL